LLDLDEGVHGFRFLTEEKIASVFVVVVVVVVSIGIAYDVKLSIYLFPKFFLSFTATRFFINPDYWLILMTSPPINPD
jgi:hypothetical protein